MRLPTIGAVVLSLSLANLAHATERIPADVREHVTQRVDQGYCVGIVVGVVDPEGSEFLSLGRFSKDGDRKVDENTIFEIGSITKVFTSLLLADMVERGVVKLDDPVQALLPADAKAPSRGDKPISLRDLAMHRSGLPRLPDNLEPADLDNPYADYTGERLLKFLAGYELSRDPGAEYDYSNLGAGLLGFALANRAGQSYEQCIVARISEPLGLADTRVRLSEAQRQRLAPGHADGQQVKNWDLDALAGAGAIRSTAKDMLRFVSANLGIESTSLSKAMQATHGERFETGEPNVLVALGWHVLTSHGATIIWHNGGTGGYHSFCGFNPTTKRGVVVLTNTSEDIDDIGRHLLEPKFNLRGLKSIAKFDRAAFEDYLGYYELAPGAVMHISREGDQLFAQLTGQPKLAIFPESESKFFLKVVDAQLSFVRGENGKVDQLVLHQNGDHQAKKLTDYKPTVRTEIKLAPEVLAQYVGKYRLAGGAEFEVKLEEGQLKVKLSGQPYLPVFAESETKFFYKIVEAQLSFVKDESGKVTSLVLHQAGFDQTATRMP